MSARSQEAPALEAGKTIERGIAAGEAHAYELTLEADRLVQFVSEHGELRAGLRLFDPAGKLLSVHENILRSTPLKVQSITPVAGRYRVELRAFRNQPAGQPAAGRYRLSWTLYRTPSDRERLKREIEVLKVTAQNFSRSDRFAEAQEVQERELALRRQLGDEEPAQMADLLLRLGIGARHLGDFARAESVFLEAARLAEQRLGPEATILAETFDSLANLYLVYGGDYTVVAGYLQRALVIQEKAHGPHSIFVANTLHQLGNFYFGSRQYEKAEPVYRRELRIREQQTPEHQTLAHPLTMLGRIAHLRGQFESAETDLQRAVALIEKASSRDLVLLANAFFVLGKVSQDRGRLAEALDYYHRASELFARSRGAEHVTAIEALDALAQLKLAQDETSAALTYQTKALAAAGRSLRALLSVGSEQQRRSFLALYGQQMETLLSLQLRLAPANDEVRDLAAATLLQRKGLVQETLALTLANLRRRVDPAAQTTLDEWQSATSQLSRLVLDGPAPRSNAAEHQQRVEALAQKLDQLESELSRRSAGAFQPARPVGVDEIQRAVPKNAALVEFAVYRPFDPKAPTYGERYGAPRYAACIIRAQGRVEWRDLGEAAPLEAAIDAWRAALRDPKRTDATRLGHAVSRRLMAPLQPLLTGVEHLLISPDGALNLIPFEALPEAAGRYLIESREISYLTSGRDLLRWQKNASPPALLAAPAGAPLVIADPWFGEPGAVAGAAAEAPSRTAAAAPGRRAVTGDNLNDVYFAPLFATVREARMIKNLFGEARVLTGDQATEAALKQINAPRLLHLATHGFFLADAAARQEVGVNPLLRSGLALAQANLRQRNAAGEDGILTALEAAGLNLWGTQLVTLSACDTGLGEVRNGEGIYGLRRAFALAGAETLVMSLWPVSDQATLELMTAFYTNLQHGAGRGAALRTARLRLLKRPDRRAPYYWAGFIQTGEWGEMGKRERGIHGN